MAAEGAFCNVHRGSACGITILHVSVLLNFMLALRVSYVLQDHSLRVGTA